MSSAEFRHRLIERLAARGITDRRVLEAMEEVPRERFVSDEYDKTAYADRALPIDAGQTISQPFMVALMTQELRLTGAEHVLEIGTGSGYQAAILAKLCRQVTTVERIDDLSHKARRLLAELGMTNIEFQVGDGTCGWPPSAPYDRIIVTAGAPRVPPALYGQLRPGGRLVIPVGSSYPQTLQTIVREETGPQITNVCDCTFVPLVGEEGWPSEDD